jgi:hypothetical protein
MIMDHCMRGDGTLTGQAHLPQGEVAVYVSSIYELHVQRILTSYTNVKTYPGRSHPLKEFGLLGACESK